MEVKEFEMPDGSKVSVPEEKWEIIFNEELETEMASITFDSLALKELECYVLLKTAYESKANMYLTSAYNNGAYGDPRIQSEINANWTGVIFEKLEVVTNNLWKAYKATAPYFSMVNFGNLSVAFSNIYANAEMNKPKIEAFTLYTSSPFPIGTKIIIRGR